MQSLCYDILIEHDPEHTDDRHFMKSKVEKTICLEKPLLEDPGDYNMIIDNFSINTEGIPLMIPEINSKQLKPSLNIGFYYTNHKIKTIFDFDENEHREFVSLFLIPYKKHPNGIKKIFKEYWLEFFDSVGWIDNLDEQCFLYDYNSFLNALNHTFRVISNNIRYDVKRKELKHFCEEGNNTSYFYFELKDNLLVLNVHKDVWKKNDYFELKNFHVCMPMYLYRFIGNGFKTKFNTDHTWEYDYDWTKLGETNESIVITQEFSTLIDWSPLKAIVIGSDSILADIDPLIVAQYNGYLNHTKTPEYIKFLETNNITDKEEQVAGILNVYYPSPSSLGEFIPVYSVKDDNRLIPLKHGTSLTKINIWIKWLDVYGNLHDLYLLPERTCNLRLCFCPKKTLN